MSEPRFYVRESAGYLIRPAHAKGGAPWTTLIHIFDRAYCHREVGRFGTSRLAWTRSTQSLAVARRWAERRCAELNAWNETA